MSDHQWRPDSVPVIDLAVRVRNIDGTLIVALNVNDPLQLNDVAAFIWQRIDGIRPVRAIIDDVATRYSVEIDAARDDVIELLTDLFRAGFVESAAGG